MAILPIGNLCPGSLFSWRPSRQHGQHLVRPFLSMSGDRNGIAVCGLQLNLPFQARILARVPHFHASNYFLDGCIMLGFASGKESNLVLIITLHRERQGALGRRPVTDWRTLGFSESPCADLNGCQEEVPRGHCIFPWVHVFRRRSLFAASSCSAGSSIFRVFV